MKKILLLVQVFLFALLAQSQTFSDDFESYTVGAMLGTSSPDWRTWSGLGGGTDDSPVVNTNAHSGTNSIYFASTATTGGPQDCVLPFGGALNAGQFNYEMWMYVNTTGYFNLQATTVLGGVWSADVYFNANGTADFTSGGTGLLQATYPTQQWFKLRMENNLTVNTWEIFIDDVSQGSYTNLQTSVSFIDIFPLTGDQFYIDDVSYEYTAYVPTPLNGAVTAITGLSGLATQNVLPNVTVRNLGTTAITSFDLTVDYNGNQTTQSVSAVNIASLAFSTVALTNPVTLAAGNNSFTVTISNVNGNASDDDATDNSKTVMIDPIVPAAGKMVVAEEGTGTWCQWCPRGAVFMNDLSSRYDGYFAGIAVHNNDPMTVDAYDAGMGNFISGFPSGLVDRNGTEFDPSQFETPFLERIQVAPAALITNGANFDATSRVLNVSASTTFQQTVTGNYRIAMVLTEDGVHGTGSSWNQSNAYSGGNNGVMGGFENLTNPVPAAQMTYDHVARFLSPNFDGLANAFSGAQTSGTTTVHNFTATLPTTWVEGSMHVITMVIAPNGTIENATSVTLEEAIANGFVNGTAVVGVTEMSQPDAAFTIYPNPAKDACNINIQLNQATDVRLDIYSADGKWVAGKNYGTLNGAYQLPVHMDNWSAGIYVARLTCGKTISTQTLIKE